MNDTERRRSGWDWLTWVVLGAGLLFGLAFFVVPNLARVRVTATPNACINNLRQIDGAKQQFALEAGLTNGSPVAWTNLVGTNSYLRVQPACPQRGDYSINPIGINPACSLGGDHSLPP